MAAANGTIQGAATITGGQLVLNGTSGNYGKLPGGLITGDSAVTIEAWADYGTLPANCYLYSLGNTDSGGSGENYIFCAPQGGRIAITAVIRVIPVNKMPPAALGLVAPACTSWPSTIRQPVTSPSIPMASWPE